jgi:ribosome assembly protein 4
MDNELPKSRLTGHRGSVLCVEWEGCERELATGGMDGTVRIFDHLGGKQIVCLQGHSRWITNLAWEPIHLNPSHPRLASSSKDGTVRIWQVRGNRCEFALGGHTAIVNAVRWGGNGKIFTASSDRTVKIWDGKDVSSLIGSRNLSLRLHVYRENSSIHSIFTRIGSTRSL